MIEKFSAIYENGGWSNMGSGPGAAPSYNKSFLVFLAEYMKTNNFNSIIDFGCGDWQMFRGWNFGGIRYTGYDIVDSVIKRNNRTYSSRNISFRHITSVDEITEVCDIFLVKDVLIHLPNTLSRQILDHAKTVSKTLLIVNDYLEEDQPVNADIDACEYRPVDVSMPPLSERALTLLKYGTQYRRVRNIHSLKTAILGERVQSGRKHVQMVFGDIIAA